VGQVIDVSVQLTANHFGYFVFRVCPVTDESREVTQECLNKHELKVDGTNYPKYKLSNAKTGIFTVKVKLPDGLSCDRCVFQWDYRSGNNWGKCEDRSMKTGCGPQETFRGCADIRIGSGNSIPHNIIDEFTEPTKLNPTTETVGQNCISANSDFRFNELCRTNCARGYCPSSFCECK
jgi:hypothetical protein